MRRSGRYLTFPPQSALPSSDMLPNLAIPPRRTWFFGATSKHHSADFRFVHSVAARVVPVSSGPTSYGTSLTTHSRLWRHHIRRWRHCPVVPVAVSSTTTMPRLINVLAIYSVHLWPTLRIRRALLRSAGNTFIVLLLAQQRAAYVWTTL